MEVGKPTWKKGSRSSGGANNCVELAWSGAADGAVRDSKNPDGPVLKVEMTSLVATVKGGNLDR